MSQEKEEIFGGYHDNYVSTAPPDDVTDLKQTRDIRHSYICDICNDVLIATAEHARKSGWEITDRWALCEKHN